MDFESFLGQGLSLTGAFNPTIAVVLFLICFISELLAFSIPYLLETTWLLVGYQFVRGILSPVHLLLMLSMTIGGREAGALLLYRLSRLGSKPLLAFVNKITEKTAMYNGSAAKAVKKINTLSPVSVATGRLLWLRIPLTLMLSVQKKPRLLFFGVLISSIIYDAVYIAVGAIVGTTVKLDSPYMILFFLGGLTVLYACMLLARWLRKYILKRRHAADDEMNEEGNGEAVARH